jgi:hypothetical protein
MALKSGPILTDHHREHPKMTPEVSLGPILTDHHREHPKMTPEVSLVLNGAEWCSMVLNGVQWCSMIKGEHGNG